MSTDTGAAARNVPRSRRSPLMWIVLMFLVDGALLLADLKYSWAFREGSPPSGTRLGSEAAAAVWLAVWVSAAGLSYLLARRAGWSMKEGLVGAVLAIPGTLVGAAGAGILVAIVWNLLKFLGIVD